MVQIESAGAILGHIAPREPILFFFPKSIGETHGASSIFNSRCTEPTPVYAISARRRFLVIHELQAGI
jgi:hypothetical protein